MIELQRLTRSFGTTVALHPLSTHIPPGAIVGLVGHNGAGKTTLLRLLAGCLAPSAGTASVGGHEVCAARRQVQAQLGYLPENAPLYLEMLVQDYLLTMGRLRGLTGRTLAGRVVWASERVGLRERLTAPIGTLSKGYRQRVGLAQAMLHQPKVLLLDEPTNGLDPMQILAMRDLIRELAAQATVIVSTHLLQEVEATCDRLLLLAGGHCAIDAPLSELLTDTAVGQSERTSLDQVVQRVHSEWEPP